MTEYIHVRIKDTGAKGSIPVKRFDPDIYEETGEDPLDHHGLPKSWKPKTSVEAARKRTRGSRPNSASPAAQPVPMSQEPEPLDPLSTEGTEPDETGLQADTPKEND